MIAGIAKWGARLLSIGLAGLIVSNCTMLSLNYASLDTANKPDPSPAIDVARLEVWAARKDELRQAFAENVYGPWPGGLRVELVSRRVADPDYAGGRGRLEEWVIEISGSDGARRFLLGVALPDGDGPFPLLIGQSFTPNCMVFASTALTGSNGAPCESGKTPFVFRYIFGEFIARAPVEALFDRGWAYASFHASELVPDSRNQAGPALSDLKPEGDAAPTGTIAAWAYGFSAVTDLMENKPAIDHEQVVVFGHSRHGKSALVAAAWDDRIAGVISHQSGFGGAALSRSRVGEGVARITSNYPHWFDPAFARHGEDLSGLPVDQHQLLALIAPRPVFLGNARRDVWSDPNSTYRAAEAASEVWTLHGESGLEQDGLTDWRPDSPVAYWLRNGGHGTDQRDVDAILAFLDAHFPRPQFVACDGDQLASLPPEGC